MGKQVWLIVALTVISLSWPSPAPAQTVTPESLAAAKELIIETKVAEHIKLIVPAVLQQAKPRIARGNPRIEKDFDALVPFVLSALNDRLEAFLDAAGHLYAKEFTADEIKHMLDFYRTPTGQKFLEKTPGVMQELMALGRRFGDVVASDAVSRMTEELRKRGHNI